MFKNIKKEDLFEIYLDYCLSKKEGRRCESLVPFAEKYKNDIKIGDLMSLRESLNIVEIIFLNEIAERYFNLRKE